MVQFLQTFLRDPHKHILMNFLKTFRIILHEWTSGGAIFKEILWGIRGKFSEEISERFLSFWYFWITKQYVSECSVKILIEDYRGIYGIFKGIFGQSFGRIYKEEFSEKKTLEKSLKDFPIKWTCRNNPHRNF